MAEHRPSAKYTIENISLLEKAEALNSVTCVISEGILKVFLTAGGRAIILGVLCSTKITTMPLKHVVIHIWWYSDSTCSGKRYIAVVGSVPAGNKVPA